MRRKVQPHRWRNWSQTVDCAPAHRAFPVTTEEVQSEVLRCSEEAERLRVVGRGHAFTALCQSNENLMSLDLFTGIESEDRDARRVWVRAGTRLYRLGAMLAARGLSLPAFSDYTRQTLGGAVATGCHGTGRDISSIAALVTGVRMVLPNGSVQTFTEADGETFNAVRVSLGVLGVVTHLQLQCCENYRLEARRRRDTLPRVINDLDRLRHDNRHLTLFWFPFTEQVDVLTRNPSQERRSHLIGTRTAQDFITDNLLGWGLSQLGHRLPSLAERSRRLASHRPRERAWISDAHAAFGTPRLARYVATEFAIPAEALPAALEQMSRLIRALRFRVHLPVTVRFAPADSLWLSPACGRDTAFIHLQMPSSRPYAEFFAAMTEIFDRHDGRPHWGQLHSKKATDLRRLYARFDDFLALRALMDPRGLLMNRYLSQMLDVPEQ